MDSSIFMDKMQQPTEEMLANALGSKINLWNEIRDFVFEKYPAGKEEWNFPGKKYGWSFRIKDKKRAIIYLEPRNAAFMAAFVFGQKATDQVLESDIRQSIKDELQTARVYAEGRGVRIPVTDESLIGDIKKLIQIKLAH